MTRWTAAALLAGAAMAHAQTPPPAAPASAPAASAPSSPAKKELLQKLLQLQQPGIETVARGLVERPAAQMMQEAGRVLQTQVPAEKREAAGKAIEADVKRYVDESVPLVRDRAVKLAPQTIGVTLEERFSEDELRAIIAWFESPVNRKYQQAAAEMQNGFLQKLLPDARPLVDPKLQALEQKVRATLMAAAAPASGASGSSAAPSPKPAGTPKTPAK